MLVELFTNIAGTSVFDATNAPAYLANLFFTNIYSSTFSYNLGFVDGPGKDGWSNNYAARITGYLTPPASGVYRFYIRSDDSSMLSINGTVIAYENTANVNYGVVSRTIPPNFRTSVGIPLTGRREILHGRHSERRHRRRWYVDGLP